MKNRTTENTENTDQRSINVRVFRVFRGKNKYLEGKVIEVHK